MRAVCQLLDEDKLGTCGGLADNLLLGHQAHPTHKASSSVPVTPIQTSQNINRFSKKF